MAGLEAPGGNRRNALAILALSSVRAKFLKAVSKGPVWTGWVRGAEAPPSLFWDQAEEGGGGSSGLWPWAVAFMWSRMLMACLRRPSTLRK